MKSHRSKVLRFDASKYLHKRFGRLLVTGVDVDISRKYDPTKLVCLCDCGAQKVTSARNLTSGDTTSCGCLALEVRKKLGEATIKHGHATHGVVAGLTPIYTCWVSIRALCAGGVARGHHRACHDYDPRWDDFKNFYADFGDINVQQTIKRMDRKTSWCKENCYIADGYRGVRDYSRARGTKQIA